MARKIVAGNWKMNLLRSEAESFFQGLISQITELPPEVEVYLFPTFAHLGGCPRNPRYTLGAQDCSDQAKGAYTGEVSASILASYGVGAVIVGHSERRARFHEGKDLLRRKLALVQEAQMTPFYCVGESAEIRAKGEEAAWAFVEEQLDTLEGIDLDPSRLVIAYEPIWAIGTGVTATPDDAGWMCSHIAQEMQARFGVKIPVLYGGSCNAKNARELFAQPGVSGGLIGGASLEVASFMEIGKSF